MFLSKISIQSCTIIHYYGKNHFCCYCLHAFVTEETLNSHKIDSLKISGKERIIIPKKVNILNSKILKEK